jgi:hypothetical protein
MDNEVKLFFNKFFPIHILGHMSASIWLFFAALSGISLLLSIVFRSFPVLLAFVIVAVSNQVAFIGFSIVNRFREEKRP